MATDERLVLALRGRPQGVAASSEMLRDSKRSPRRADDLTAPVAVVVSS